MRYERKYRLEGVDPEWVRQWVVNHPNSFRLLYPDRQVNNIYLDSLDFDLYNQNLAGAGTRKKYRIRWYGSDLKNLNNPVLETKIRINELGAKEYVPLENRSMPNRASFLKYIDKEKNMILPLQPVFVNSYIRSYYQSIDTKFRITLDRNLVFYPYPDSGKVGSLRAKDDAVILEVKYDESLDSLWHNMAQSFPFRQSKNSKFVVGVQLTAS